MLWLCSRNCKNKSKLRVSRATRLICITLKYQLWPNPAVIGWKSGYVLERLPGCMATFTPEHNLESEVNLTCMSVDCGEKQRKKMERKAPAGRWIQTQHSANTEPLTHTTQSDHCRPQWPSGHRQMKRVLLINSTTLQTTVCLSDPFLFQEVRSELEVNLRVAAADSWYY